MHLAEINVARLRYPLDDPRVADFANNLDLVNGLAERSEGFLWRLKDEAGNATGIDAFGDPLIIVNMSVWRSVEALHAFAYNTVHRRFVQRRQEWFEPFEGPFLALWWVEEGRWPAPIEGRRRLAHLDRVGPTAYAFNFRKLFEPRSDAAPLVAVDDVTLPRREYRSCG